MRATVMMIPHPHRVPRRQETACSEWHILRASLLSFSYIPTMLGFGSPEPQEEAGKERQEGQEGQKIQEKQKGEEGQEGPQEGKRQG